MARHLLTFMMLHTYLTPFIAIAAITTWFLSMMPVRSFGVGVEGEKRDAVIAGFEQIATAADVSASSTATDLSTLNSSWHYVRTVTGNMTERGLATGGARLPPGGLSTLQTSTISPGSTVRTDPRHPISDSAPTTKTPMPPSSIDFITMTVVEAGSAGPTTTQTETWGIETTVGSVPQFISEFHAIHPSVPSASLQEISASLLLSLYGEAAALASTSTEEPPLPSSKDLPAPSSQVQPPAATSSSSIYFSGPSASAASLSTMDILTPVHIGPTTSSIFTTVSTAEASSAAQTTSSILSPAPAAASYTSAVTDASANPTLSISPTAMTTNVPAAAQTTPPSPPPLSTSMPTPSRHSSNLARLGIGVAAAVLMVLIMAASVGFWQYKKRMEARKKREVEAKAVWYVHRTYTVESVEREEREKVGGPQGWIGEEPVLGVDGGEKGKARWTLTMPTLGREGWKGLDG